MDLFVDDAALAALEARQREAQGPEAAALLVELAWHYRQRDSRHALALADQAALRLGDGPEARAGLARLDLMRAEVVALFAEFERSQALLEQARQAMQAAGDLVGIGDSHLTAGMLASVQGDNRGNLAEAERAFECYGAAGVAERALLARAWAAVASTFGDQDSTARRIAELEAGLGAAGSNAAARRAAGLLLGIARSYRLFNAARYTEAVIDFSELLEPAMRLGMVHFCLRIGNSLGASLANLDDKEGALDWVERNLKLARTTRWPLAMGDTLALLGGVLREAGELERSLAMLTEAAQWLQVAPLSRGNALVQCYLGHAELAAQRPEQALLHARNAERIAGELGILPVKVDAMVVAARAESRLGRGEVARASAERALADAERQSNPVWLAAALQGLAEIESAWPREGSSERALGLLERALAVNGGSEDVDILEALSRFYEAAGDPARAVQAERQARARMAGAQTKRVANRLSLLEMRHQAEQQRALIEYQRGLAEAEAARARELEASFQILENLGRIGREITANLDLDNVLNALATLLGELLPVSYVGISVVEPGGREMMRRSVEDGRPLPPARIDIDDPVLLAARCARERQEILVEHDVGGELGPSHIPGTRGMHASWFGPLSVGETLFGVLTIQSEDERAYGPRERLIFRTLSAYVAVAVANARTHSQLVETEAEMRRLAVTDALTGIPNRRQFLAMLAHEVERSRRHGRPLAVVLVDIDYFKSINDQHGHPAGDSVLVRVAGILDHHRRAVDTVGRLGGEEFAILLPETDAQAARAVAERLRVLVEADWTCWEGKSIAVTASFGCASLDAGELAPIAGCEDNDPAALVLKRADQALYRAKHSGRNRTEVFEAD
ncbi:sensor domain-containing diguanylate cyclase [Chitinimonas koreensis]|uniref:sensor domain-containing diguanylate cyclase n=2 Tax=Chitinimonas koreensis TaxID=356302 RepID=UPI0004063A3D|nr:sensor domain-containing diguanylate cyclase [Chitinimonas koreensis]